MGAAGAALTVAGDASVTNNALKLRRGLERFASGPVFPMRERLPVGAPPLIKFPTAPNHSNTMKQEAIEIEGRVHTILPSTMFRVELDNKHLVLATICGKMRKRWIRLCVGDRVKLEMSPYDLTKARITWRIK